MTTALKTRTKVGALAAAAVSVGIPVLALAPSASAATVVRGENTNLTPVFACSGSHTLVKSKVKRLTNAGDEITLQVKQDQQGCISVRVTMPPYLSAANSGAEWRNPTAPLGYGATGDVRWRVQGFYGEGGSAKTLSDGKNYYETGYFRPGMASQYVQYSNWGSIVIGVTPW